MHVTLHLTARCNQYCKYCYSSPVENCEDMSRTVIDRAIEFSQNNFNSNIGIIFFGGEPLLRKDLIGYTIKKCNEISKKKNFQSYFHFIDDEFLKFSCNSKLNIGLSIDGIKYAHDKNRIAKNGESSFAIIDGKIDNILTYQPYANAFMTVSPDTVDLYAKSVEHLINRGFKYIIASLNYAGNWTKKNLSELKKQYIKLGKLYIKWTLMEKKFYFSPFEMKLASHIRGNENDCYICQLSKRQVSIAPDGKIYPCVQFVKDGRSNTEYSIGDVWNGFTEKRERLYDKSKALKTECEKCALKKRCYNTCSCLNWQTTGSINQVSPVLRETERILIPIADTLGEELYAKKAKMFIQKQYNAAYPILSMLEDENKPMQLFTV